MQITGLTGLNTKTADGIDLKIRSGNYGEVINNDYRGRFAEATYRGQCYNAAIQAVSTTTVGLATTYTGLVISNPISSTVNLELVSATVMQSVLQSTQVEAYGIAVGYNASTNVTHTTPLTVRNNLIGSSIVGQAVADISATLPTAPFYHTFASQTSTATANGPASVIEFAGRVILRPGAYALWVTPAQASVAGLWFSFDWMEIPV